MLSGTTASLFAGCGIVAAFCSRGRVRGDLLEATPDAFGARRRMTHETGRANLSIASAFVDALTTMASVTRFLPRLPIDPARRHTGISPGGARLGPHRRARGRVLRPRYGTAARRTGRHAQHLGHSGGKLPSRCHRSASQPDSALALTADRPPELRDWGAAQTIDQIRLYGDHVKWFADMPVPTEEDALSRHARATAARAVQTLAVGAGRARPSQFPVPRAAAPSRTFSPSYYQPESLFEEGSRSGVGPPQSSQLAPSGRRNRRRAGRPGWPVNPGASSSVGRVRHED